MDPSHTNHAGPSVPKNPQLGPNPWFAYPTPTPEQVEDELPPYFEGENVSMGLVTNRLVRKGYGDMRTLVEQTLPPLGPKQKPRHVIDYAKTTRHAVLKYLAILRWKTAVDIPVYASSSSNESSNSSSNNKQAVSFPTPHSNGESNDTSPGAYTGKGKGRMVDDGSPDGRTVTRGKVSDTKRITQFMEHQNRQHDEAVGHIRHTAKVVEGLRERAPDLLTAISMLNLGTYTRLPTSITEPFLAKPKLTKTSLLTTLRRLNSLIQYRLRCIDYIPFELTIDRVADGRAYMTGGGEYGWRAELSLVAFGDQSRWWLTGLEWGWRVRARATEDSNEEVRSQSKRRRKKFTGEERQGILDVVNREILPPRDIEQPPRDKAEILVSRQNGGTSTPVVGGASAVEVGSAIADTSSGDMPKIDAPLVRFHNFLQHLSLAYQLEVLFTQAMAISRERWRNNLLVEIDRTKKVLTLKYWTRPKSIQPPAGTADAQSRRSQPGAQAAVTTKSQAVGGILTVSLKELPRAESASESLRRAIVETDHIPTERIVMLGLDIKWELGSAGAGGGWKAGDIMDSRDLKLDPDNLDIEDILLAACRKHASHLTRYQAQPILTASRALIAGPSPPSVIDSDSPTSMRPTALHMPLSSRHRQTSIIVSVSALTGLIEIEDDGATFSAGQTGSEDRGSRARLTTSNVNEGKSRLFDDIGRLVAAVVTENLESQMRQLGWQPLRRLSIRSAELAKNDLHPAATIFVPLPTSSFHYLVTRLTPHGLSFELLKLARVVADNGIGFKLVIKDRSPMDLSKLRTRREIGRKRAREDDTMEIDQEEQGLATSMEKSLQKTNSNFDVGNRDLKDLYVFCNALVALNLVEQQLKDRAIPFTQQQTQTLGTMAPTSTSAVAGMIPTLSVNAKDLLKDGRAADVAMPRVFIQVKDWWKGGKCSVVTSVQLRHRSSLASSSGSPGLNNASSSSAARAEGISFDQSSSIVRFSAADISQCVPAFLEQWERLSKVIVVAGEVNQLNKLHAFRDLRMLSFDLSTATFTYYPGFNASITYSPTSDSYETTFFRSTGSTSYTPAATIATPAGAGGDTSPHEAMGGLLSWKLNEISNSAAGESGAVGKKFISLLRNTLPFLLEIDVIRANSSTDFPALVIQSVTEYRLIWDVESDTAGSKRYGLDIHLTPDGLYFLADASRPLPGGLKDLSCGVLTPIPNLRNLLEGRYKALRNSPLTPTSTTAVATASSPSHAVIGRGKPGRGILAMRLDSGQSLLCVVGVIGDVVRILCAEIEVAIGAGASGGEKGSVGAV